ncbi:MAG: response regulator, partial [Myxococcales bacterium]|nr:response regulator [Myxococcales bacterium]
MSRILVIDDELSMREVLEMYFMAEGHEVLTAADGLEGQEVMDREVVDLVITDLRMPRAGGLEVLAHARAHHPHLPVIMMTAFASTETALEAMKTGAYDYFTKPFKL